MRTRARRVVLVVVVVALAASCSSSTSRATSASTSAVSSLASTTTGSTTTTRASSSRHPFGGYAESALTVTKADGSFLSWCVLLALTQAEHERGLMDVTDIGGYDGMLFRFTEPQRLAFYMFQTKIPLSIAFFDAAGSVVSTADMTPCTETNGNNCTLYHADAPYTDALEVLQGDLARLGIASGVTVKAGGACPS
jgi:uncharacterized membrane protein (UPF0127 family)